jgi:hypothetical protein
VFSQATGRFIFAAQVGLDVCVSTVNDGAPGVVEQSCLLPGAKFGVSGNPDQPHVVASDNKVAVMLDDFGPTSVHTDTLVLPIGDVLDGSCAHTQVVTHADQVRPVIAVGSGDSIFWLKIGGGQNILVGRITGVPGQNGGITTASAAVTLYDTTLSTAGVYTSGYLETVTLEPNAVELVELAGVDAPTFAPTIGQRGGFRPPATGVDFSWDARLALFSVSATPSRRIVAGFLSAGLPWFVALTPSGLVGPLVVDTHAVHTLSRVDFLPVGAAFPDALHPGEWYAGVGWTDVTDHQPSLQGQHSAFFRDGQLP